TEATAQLLPRRSERGRELHHLRYRAQVSAGLRSPVLPARQAGALQAHASCLVHRDVEVAVAGQGDLHLLLRLHIGRAVDAVAALASPDGGVERHALAYPLLDLAPEQLPQTDPVRLVERPLLLGALERDDALDLRPLVADELLESDLGDRQRHRLALE